MSGKGVLNTKAGCYDGAFVGNQMHGAGVFTYADGSVYTGPFDHGERSGVGELKFEDGGKYVGPFQVIIY